jgi:hypothetical protein
MNIDDDDSELSTVPIPVTKIPTIRLPDDAIIQQQRSSKGRQLIEWMSLLQDPETNFEIKRQYIIDTKKDDISENTFILCPCTWKSEQCASCNRVLVTDNICQSYCSDCANYLAYHALRLSSAKKLNPSDCVVCFNRARDVVLIPCGHYGLCEMCAQQLFHDGTKECPICRRKINQIVKLFNV